MDSIEGIGPKTIEALFQNFKTIEGIKNANEVQLQKIAGIKKSKLIKEYFKKQNL